MKAALTFLFLALLASCSDNRTASVDNTSPNKKVLVHISGTCAGLGEPWKVLIGVKAYSFKEGKLEVEVYADELSDKTVKFDWKDDKTCLITFEQKDGKPRTFQLIADATQVLMQEVNP